MDDGSYKPKEPETRNYKVEQMVAAAQRGATRKIERLKAMAASLEEQQRKRSSDSVKKSLTE